MSNHLTTEEIATAVAGLELEAAVANHLENCVACRAEVADLAGLIGDRREDILADEPDWVTQTEQILDRLPTGVETADRQGARWLRPVLAVAAGLVVAAGLGILRPDGTVEPPAGEPSVEEILAEMDELLSDDSIPGFEIIDPDGDDLETYFNNGAS